ncbi:MULTISPECIES: TetR/AcrR family transcriptional regulator [Pseudoalteromonas]|jgi:TetR/AcrR family transcriptional repressor of mexJK operon|uniref:TetR/AcrR family transcriptional regulator, mexJK operon transcriptional repressor n=2 Tax=Pseudoalteromonas TaxID=53246 RepID=A0ACA8DTG1_9GAMM|nr:MULTISPECIES: TetR/AcrR family transcriptional regulator [Pseudoalteromonas]MDY6887158.1 TetR/AcrR family transcriptional regulator [Pseudomonadota bacterium]GEK78449.1 TetR family transcriptional regulator [Pseudoalteromonas atlantica]ATC81335.1 TetR/AcrR family transcriptional regulator, mexJK operon transcriptional repressor [Pseudoalteromonas agarivorans DSM 14585]ETJ47532.1 transcription regulator protein [Pseudoalteromonas agarivorans]MCK8108253.1 TetR/AcrR family transcriptional regu|tara:strand:- start:1478 stop:2146 length:669 start_codon:yes stop_codon:yes gene_type:complete
MTKTLTNAQNTLPPSELELGAKARTVLHAARKIFLIHGFNGATTDMIQREAGVSKSTVYAHFANKEILFLAVIKSECEIFTASIDNITFKPGNLTENLRRLGHAYLQIALSETAMALYRIVVAEAPRLPALGHMFYNSGPRVVKDKVSNYLKAAVESKELDFEELNIEEATNLFVALMRSELHLMYLTHPDQPVLKKDIDRWVEVAINFLVRSYGTAHTQKN